MLSLFQPDGNPSRPGAGTVAGVIRAYLDYLRARVAGGEFSADAFDNTQRDLNRFAQWRRGCPDHPQGAVAACRHCYTQGDLTTPECKGSDLVYWLLANPQWGSNHTKRRVLTTLVACFTWAAGEGDLIDECPYQKPKSMRLPTRPRREAKPEEYALLLRKSGRPLKRALYFLRRTGARTCEMREAEFKDVAWDKQFIVLYRHKTERTTGQARRILLDPGVLRFLRNLDRCKLPGQTKIFVNSRGTPWDRHTFARQLRRTAKRIGLDEGAVERVSGYMLRHSFTGAMGEAGYSDRQVATMLGHSSTRMVSNYNHNRENEKVMQNLAANLRRRPNRTPQKPPKTKADEGPFLPGMEP